MKVYLRAFCPHEGLGGPRPRVDRHKYFCKIAARSTKIDLHTVMERRMRNLARLILNHDARSSPLQTAGRLTEPGKGNSPARRAEYLLLL